MARLTSLQALDAVLVPTSYIRYGYRALSDLRSTLDERGLPLVTANDEVGLGLIVGCMEAARAGLIYYALVKPFLE